MTTSTTPTHGAPLRPQRPERFERSERSGSADVDRWLPDPSWPVPPRGWQLWAAAGAPTRTLRAERSGDDRGGSASGGGGQGRDVEPPIVHTVPVTSDMSAFDVLEEPSFTLPARPGLPAPEPVDLLADPEPRRLPEGTVSGFAVIGALVAFSCLVGGLIAGFVVIGVSTLLAAIAALVHGRVSLSSVGGQRGAALLLGAAVTALIVPSVTAQERTAAPESAAGVPVSSPFAVSTQTAYAAIPPSGDAAGSTGSTGASGSMGSAASSAGPGSGSDASGPSSANPAVPRAEKPAAATHPAVVPDAPVQAPPAAPSATAPGLTLALDALDPKSADVDDHADEHADEHADKHGPPAVAAAPKPGTGKGSGKGSGKATDKAAEKASKAADKASEKAAKAAKAAQKAAQKAAEKAAERAAKASEKAAKAAVAEATKAAKEAAAQARKARSLTQQATKSTATGGRALLGTLGTSETKKKTIGTSKASSNGTSDRASTGKASKAAPKRGVSAKSAR